MRTLLLAIITALAVAGAPTAGGPTESDVPSWYYDSPCQQPVGVSLYDWLAKLQHRVEVTPDAFDCSQTATYIEWLCENCGHDTVIACNTGHCWVIVEGDSYETTSLHWEVAGQHKALVHAQDIYEAWGLWTKLGSEAEWGWWVTHPELQYTLGGGQ